MNTNSPYQAPKSKVDFINDSYEDFEVASNWRRLSNYLVDSIVIYILSIPVVIMVISEETMNAIIEGKTPEENLLLNVTYILLMLAYYILFEGLFGRTPGKFVTGTRVVDADGEKVSGKQAILRSLSRFVPFEPLSFFFGEPGGWHDKWTKTFVVRK